MWWCAVGGGYERGGGGVGELYNEVGGGGVRELCNEG